MFKLSTRALLGSLLAASIAVGGASAEPATPALPKAVKTGRQLVNGVDYYYAVYGRGEPLLLLHGGLGSIEMFGTVLPALAKHRKVIAVDLHGHGRTPLGDRPFRLQSMGDDMVEIVKALGHEKLDVLGYCIGRTPGFAGEASRV